MSVARRIAALEKAVEPETGRAARWRAERALIDSDPAASYLDAVYRHAVAPWVCLDPDGYKGTVWKIALLRERRAQAAVRYCAARVDTLRGETTERLHLRDCGPWGLATSRALLEEVAALPGGAGAVDLTMPPDMERWRGVTAGAGPGRPVARLPRGVRHLERLSRANNEDCHCPWGQPYELIWLRDPAAVLPPPVFCLWCRWRIWRVLLRTAAAPDPAPPGYSVCADLAEFVALAAADEPPDGERRP